MLDASEIYARRLDAEEVLSPKNGEEFIFPFADEAVKLAGCDQAIQDDPARGEGHNDVLQGEPDGSLPSDQQADGIEARHDFWRVSGHHICRHLRSTKGYSQFHWSTLMLSGGQT